MRGMAEKVAAQYTFDTVLGVWLIVVSFIASIIFVALAVRTLFPIKPTPLHSQKPVNDAFPMTSTGKRS